VLVVYGVFALAGALGAVLTASQALGAIGSPDRG
jgi:hypothetical protein